MEQIVDKYETAIKETFKYLEDCMSRQPGRDTLEYLYNLGIDKCFIIKNQMQKKGFEVNTNTSRDGKLIAVIPTTHNLPSHIWREK